MTSSSLHRFRLIAFLAFGAMLFFARGGMAASTDSGHRAEEMRRHGCCCVIEAGADCCCNSSVSPTRSTPPVTEVALSPTAHVRLASPSNGDSCHCRSSVPPSPAERPKARGHEGRGDPGLDSTMNVPGARLAPAPRRHGACEVARHLLNSPLHLRTTRLLI